MMCGVIGGSTGRPLDVKMLAGYSDLSKSKLSGPLSISMNGRHEVPRRTSLAHVRLESTCSVHLTRKPWKLANTAAVNCIPSQTQVHSASVSDEEIPSNKETTTIPSSEVQSLLTNICNTSSIAEFKLNLGSFHLYVKRDINGIDSTVQPQISHPVPVASANQTPATNGSASVTSLVVSKASSSPSEIERFSDDASSEGLMMLQSPKVGVFRRARRIKGKLLPPPCQEKGQVKAGQVICFIEQLGGQTPMKTDIAGEVVKILRVDGEPVGYGDNLVAILPSSPGTN